MNGNKILASIAVGGAMFLSSCANQPDYRPDKTPPPTVASVDLNRYAGLWYEIARYPNSFQQDCGGVTAEYTLRDDGKIRVVNTCRTGDPRSSEGVARVVEGSNGSKLKVQFAPEWVPFAAGDYWILMLAEDYRFALVGDPDGKYLWILSRTPTMTEDTLSAIKSRAEELGYATAPLQETSQPEN